MPTKQTFHIPKEQREELKRSLQAYFLDELEMELSDLQADFFVDFIGEKMGMHFYNLGISDAMAFMKEKAEDLVLLMKEE